MLGILRPPESPGKQRSMLPGPVLAGQYGGPESPSGRPLQRQTPARTRRILSRRNVRGQALGARADAVGGRRHYVRRLAGGDGAVGFVEHPAVGQVLDVPLDLADRAVVHQPQSHRAAPAVGPLELSGSTAMGRPHRAHCSGNSDGLLAGKRRRQDDDARAACEVPAIKSRMFRRQLGHSPSAEDVTRTPQWGHRQTSLAMISDSRGGRPGRFTVGRTRLPPRIRHPLRR
jgi:hypothetical protein